MPVAIIDPLELLTESRTAARTGLSIHTLRKHRKLRKGIPWVALGRTIRYRTADVEAYLVAHLVEPGKPKGFRAVPAPVTAPAKTGRNLPPHLRGGRFM